MVNVNIDISELLELEKRLVPAMREALVDAGTKLTKMTEAHIREMARQKLHTRLKMFEDGLTSHQVSDDTWVIDLAANVRWVDDGKSPGSMLPGLLASPKAKTAKDGSKFLVVPFRHDKGPTQATPAQQTLTDTIRKTLKDAKIPYKKVELDAAGNPRQGLLHKLDITHSPIRKDMGRGQGAGPVGAVMQGPTGIPLLKGLRIYQRQNSEGKTQREIFTFRVASSKHEAQGRWRHPGTEPLNLLEEGAEWALRTWDKEILPAIQAKMLASL